MSESWQWISDNGVVLGWLGVSSVVMFVGTLIVIPFLVAQIPPDYFVDRERHMSRSHALHPALYMMLTVTKNLAGVVLILAGVAMLVLPGQGLLTILLGILLTNFPGKYTLERKLVSMKSVFNAINWFRKRGGKEPLLRPNAEASDYKRFK